jgi:uncharacterized protein (DUF1501 family)
MSNHHASDDDHHDEAPAGLANAAREGCAESRLLMTRRSLFGITAGLYSSAFLPDFAQAAVNPEARLLVVVLRGGMDGLNMVVPKLDSRYATSRKQIAIPFASTLSLGADFGLHPGLARLHTMYNAGEAAFVPAAGLQLSNRSHFDCQDNLENGLPANSANATGWLNRMLGALPAGDPIRVRGGIEIGDSPLILNGPEPVLGWSPTWFEKAAAEFRTTITNLYSTNSAALLGPLSRGLAADDMALAAGAGNSGDISVLRKAFIGAARLMKQPSGPRVSVLSVGGWDTHSSQGGLTGQYNDRLRELDQALGDLKLQLGGAVWAKTICVLVTEFGRTVVTNGDSGTDHGYATVATLVGGAVKSGIKGDWPGLAPNQLFEGRDLKAAVDQRSIFKGVLRDHLGIAPSMLEATIFPGSLAAKPLDGLVKRPVVQAASERIAFKMQSERRPSPISAYRAQFAGSASLN